MACLCKTLEDKSDGQHKCCITMQCIIHDILCNCNIDVGMTMVAKQELGTQNDDVP